MHWFAFLSYVFISTFTPGINNLISATSGSNIGYKRTLPFLSGVSIGFFVIMLLSSFFIDLLYQFFPSIEIYLKIFGSSYIIYLAISIFFPKKTKNIHAFNTYSIKQGIFLQLINPKLIVYVITILSIFINNYLQNSIILFFFVIFLTLIVFLATSLWALLGSYLSKFLNNPKYLLAFNTIMSLLLLYTALNILDIF